MSAAAQDVWTERLSEYVDGELDAEERAELERHLESCAVCARTVAQLRAVVATARALRPTEPVRDLWPDIALGIERGIRAPATVTPRARRRISFSVPQLAAAAVVVALASGLVGRHLRPEPDRRAARPVPVADDAVRLAGEAAPPPGYADELARLQRTLDEGRSRLDPNTVRILDKNLAVIDRAIRESQEALAVDPGNQFLQDHLERAYRGKVDYLREANAMLSWGA